MRAHNKRRLVEALVKQVLGCQLREKTVGRFKKGCLRCNSPISEGFVVHRNFNENKGNYCHKCHSVDKIGLTSIK